SDMTCGVLAAVWLSDPQVNGGSYDLLVSCLSPESPYQQANALRGWFLPQSPRRRAQLEGEHCAKAEQVQHPTTGSALG
ncbi:MAG: hypothetical protein OK454_03765, partial [Thaumarchaeota archaeon]|nr:hypothetical protein [Nitrososphaerota archaeon]